LYELERNVKLAKTAEIPVVRVQVDAMNLLWHLFEPYFCLVFDLFHIGQGDFKRYARWGWFWREKEISHLQRGSVWALCSPVNVFINVADPMACREIFRRNRDFVRPNHLYGKTDPNLFFKASNSFFSSSNDALVWTECRHGWKSGLAAATQNTWRSFP